MRLHRTLTPIVFTLLLLFWPALVYADFQAGVDAYNQGDYATALKNGGHSPNKAMLVWSNNSCGLAVSEKREELTLTN